MRARALSRWGVILEGWLAVVVAFELLQRHAAWAVVLTVLACLVDAARRRQAALAYEGTDGGDTP